MAISDVSNLNNLIARGIQAGNQPYSSYDVLSGGTLPDTAKNKIDNLVREALDNTPLDQAAPMELYDQVAEIMIGTTPGMSVETLSNVLQTTGLLNKAQNALPSLNIENELSQITNKYTSKLRNVTGAIDGALAEFGLPGFAQNAANAVINETMNILNGELSASGILDLTGKVPSVDKIASGVIAQVVSGNDLISLDTLKKIGPVSDAVESLADGAGIVDLVEQNSDTLKSMASEVLAGGANILPEDAKSLMSEDLNRTLTGLELFDVKKEDFIGIPPYEIGTGNLLPGGQFISSVEELEAEMGSMTRDISEIIVHWSETFTNANLTASDLTNLTGSGDNAYHMIIKRDGSIERGVDMNSVGSHTPINNHDAYSIGVCLVGGVNVPSGNENIVEETSSRSITRSQWNSLYQIFRTFFNQYPGGQALGHMDIDISQEDPGFDVRDYVYNNFNKQSLYNDPPSDPALSPQEIVAKQSGQAVISDATLGDDVADLEEPTTFELEKDPDVLEKNF